MIYPLLTLMDGTIIVYVETPDAVDGFHSLECILPGVTLRNVQGYTLQEQQEILDTIKESLCRIYI